MLYRTLHNFSIVPRYYTDYTIRPSGQTGNGVTYNELLCGESLL